MLLIAVILLAAAPADRWVHVGRSANLYEEYVDVESVTRSGDRVTLWTRRDLIADRGTAWTELEFDCSRRTETILAYVEEVGGSISHNAVRPHRGAAPISAGSLQETIFKIACR
jgi:hypothetical protein